MIKEFIINKAGLSESDLKEILKETNQELIIKATQLNPQDIKKVIDTIILAKNIYKQNIKNNIDKIIAILGFYFHGNKWKDFLNLLIPYEQRIYFLTHFILFLESRSKDITNLEDLTKILEGGKYKDKKEESNYLFQSLMESYQGSELCDDIYSKLIEINDNDLFIFLKLASVPLLKIDKIENYLRIVDTTDLTIKREEQEGKIINTQEQLELLQNEQVSEFNDYRKNENVLIHLPYADLQKLKLTGKINLSNSFLFKANLSFSDLKDANLDKADLAKADLREADLRGAKLSRAYCGAASFRGANLKGAELRGTKLSFAHLKWSNLTGVDLRNAILIRTYLREADLSRADLKEADLLMAYLKKANLSWADLRGAKLLWANLLWADLRGAKVTEASFVGADMRKTKLIGTEMVEVYLTDADLTNSIIIDNTSEKTIVSGANFENALIDNREFYEYLRNNKCKNIPEKEIKTKEELRLELESRNLDIYFIKELLELSKLPSSA